MPYIFLLPAIFLNPWIWKIWEQNWLVALLLIPTTAVYYAILLKQISRKITVLIILAISLAVLVIFSVSFDPRLLNPTPTEIWTINQRRNLYPPPLGRIFQNKAFLTLDKITGNIFTGLDPNLYFFISHPRERLGISEFPKLSPWFLPVFLIGLFFWLSHFRKIFLFPLILSLILTSVSDPASPLGPIAFLPWVSSLIAWGIYKLT